MRRSLPGEGTGLYLDCVNADILVLIQYYSFAKCYHWETRLKSIQDTCILSYSCMWIYNDIKIKILTLENGAVKETLTLLINRHFGRGSVGIARLCSTCFSVDRWGTRTFWSHAHSCLAVHAGCWWISSLELVAFACDLDFLTTWWLGSKVECAERESQMKLDHRLQLNRGRHAVLLLLSNEWALRSLRQSERPSSLKEREDII